MEMIRKTLDFNIRQVGAPADRTLEFIGTTPEVDRYGDIIEMDGWEIDNYLKNPVFLWAHDYKQPPIGKALAVEKTPRGLVFRIRFAEPEIYPFADTIYKLYLGGYLRATSVGFRDLEREPITDQDGRQTGWRYKRQELYELSAVPVPANPNALMLAVQKGVLTPGEVEEVMGVPYEEDLMQEAGIKGVIPFKAYPTEPEDAPWDGPAEIKAAEVEDLKVICTWYDSEKPDVKSSYKLPHHRAKGYRVVWRGVSAAMAALLGARGGVDVPEKDRQGIYDHLVQHYAQFDKEPPEFRAYAPMDLFLIELGLPPVLDRLTGRKGEMSDKDVFQLLLQLITTLYEWLLGGKGGELPGPVAELVNGMKSQAMEMFAQGSAKALEEFFKAGDGPVVKAGAVLSARNKAALKQAQALIQEVLDSAERPASEETEEKDIYAMALNPGVRPSGGRPAMGLDIHSLLEQAKQIHRQVKGGKHHER